MDVRLRAYEARDFDFARQLYFETMRWAIERVFGWNEARQHASFAEWFKPEEVSVITADGLDVGWIQKHLDDNGIHLGSIYVAPAMQRKGIGSGVIQALLQTGRQKSKPVTLAVMKINPALTHYRNAVIELPRWDEFTDLSSGTIIVRAKRYDQSCRGSGDSMHDWGGPDATRPRSNRNLGRSQSVWPVPGVAE